MSNLKFNLFRPLWTNRDTNMKNGGFMIDISNINLDELEYETKFERGV